MGNLVSISTPNIFMRLLPVVRKMAALLPSTLFARTSLAGKIPIPSSSPQSSQSQTPVVFLTSRNNLDYFFCWRYILSQEVRKSRPLLYDPAILIIFVFSILKSLQLGCSWMQYFIFVPQQTRSVELQSNCDSLEILPLLLEEKFTLGYCYIFSTFSSFSWQIFETMTAPPYPFLNFLKFCKTLQSCSSALSLTPNLFFNLLFQALINLTSSSCFLILNNSSDFSFSSWLTSLVSLTSFYLTFYSSIFNLLTSPSSPYFSLLILVYFISVFSCSVTTLLSRYILKYFMFLPTQSKNRMYFPRVLYSRFFSGFLERQQYKVQTVQQRERCSGKVSLVSAAWQNSKGRFSSTSNSRWWFPKEYRTLMRQISFQTLNYVFSSSWIYKLSEICIMAIDSVMIKIKQNSL